MRGGSASPQWRRPTTGLGQRQAESHKHGSVDSTCSSAHALLWNISHWEGSQEEPSKKKDVGPTSNGGVVMVSDGAVVQLREQYASNARPVVQLPTMSMHHWPARGTACTAVAARALIRAQQFAGRRVHDCMMLQFNVQNKNNNI